jgi:co-chaperonin GroES (HSP10)
MTQKIKQHIPLGARVLVKVADIEEIKKSVLHIPENVKDRESTIVEEGTIVAIGDCAFQGWEVRDWVKVGDQISFIRHAGKIINLDGINYRLINDNDLCTKIVYEQGESEC